MAHTRLVLLFLVAAVLWVLPPSFNTPSAPEPRTTAVAPAHRAAPVEDGSFRVLTSRTAVPSTHPPARLGPRLESGIIPAVIDERDPTARLFPLASRPTWAERTDFDPTGRLTEDGRARRCPVALAELGAMEAALPDRDRCGWAHAALTPLMDAAFERGCLTDGEWGAFYERVGQHRAQMGGAVSLDTLVGLTAEEACGQDAWAQADLTEAHACAALMRQDGFALLGPEVQTACAGSAVLQSLPFDLGPPPG